MPRAKLKHKRKMRIANREIKSDFVFSKRVAYLYGLAFALVGALILLRGLAAPSPPMLSKGADVVCSTANQEAPQLAAAGVKMVRIQTMSWGGVEPSKGTFNTTYLDSQKNCFNIYHHYGIKTLVLVDNTPQWAAAHWDPTVPGMPPANDQDFADFFTYVVPYLGNSVDAWEIYNEPNLGEFWNGDDNDYANLLNAAYPAIKTADVRAGLCTSASSNSCQRVVMAGLAMNGDAEDPDGSGHGQTAANWLKRMYADHAQSDVIALHPYPRLNEPSDSFSCSNSSDTGLTIKQGIPNDYGIMKSHGDGDKPIWLTEWGYESSGCMAPALDYMKTNEPYIQNTMWFIDSGIPLGDTASGQSTNGNNVFEGFTLFDDPYVNKTTGPWQIGPKSGWAFKDVSIDWGDGSVPISNQTSLSATHTYPTNNTVYTAHVTLDYSGAGATPQSVECQIYVGRQQPHYCAGILFQTNPNKVVTATVGGSPWLIPGSKLQNLKAWPANQPAPSAQLTLSSTSSSVNVNLSADSPYSNIKQVDYYAGKGKLQTITSYPFQLDMSKLSPGPYDAVVAVVTDYNGQQTTSNSVAFDIKGPDTAPSVSIGSPKDQATVSGSVTITATATDDQSVSDVVFKLDSTTVADLKNSANTTYQTTVDMTKFSEGAHTITVTATDNTGHSSSASINITIKDADDTPPTVSITSPKTNSTYRSGDTVKLTAQASDSDSGVANVQFYDNGRKIGSLINTSDAGSASGQIVPIGKTSVFQAATNGSCSQLTDLPVTGFKDSAGQLQLIAANGTNNYRFTGPSINSLSYSCSPILTADQSPDPSKFNDFEWLASTYSEDGKTVYGLAHEEYHAWLYPNSGCPYKASDSKSDRFKCWYSAVTMAKSTDGGKTYTDTGQIVAALPYQYKDVANKGTASGMGMETPSGIVKSPSDSYYYALVTQIYPTSVSSPQNGECLIRTNNLNDPASWRGWDGSGFSVKFANPYTGKGSGVCMPVIKAATTSTLHGGLTYNSYLKQYLLLGPTGSTAGDLSFMSSPDLIHWSKAQVFYTAPINCSSVHYPSLIGPDGSATTGQDAWFFYTQFNNTPPDCQTFLSRALYSMQVHIIRSQGSYSYDWAIPAGLASGPHKITATATDNAGNVASSSAVSLNIDNTKPTVSISSPTDGATVSGKTVNITAIAADNVAVKSVSYTLTYPPPNNAVAALGSALSTSPYRYTWDTTGLSNGTYKLTATVVDTVGLSGISKTISVTVNNQTTPPTDKSPPSVPAGISLTTTQTSVTLSWKASTDNKGGSGVKGYNVYRVGSTDPIATTTQLSYTDSGLNKFTKYTYQITALDNATNESGKSFKHTATTKPPLPEVQASEGRTDLSGTATIAAAASTITGVSISSVDFNLACANTSTPTKLGTVTTLNANGLYGLSFDTTKFPDGSCSLSVVATDNTGQQSLPSKLAIYIDNTAPSISLVSPTKLTDRSGTLHLVAAASDKHAMGGVQFTIDGHSVGPEFTKSPYEYALDTKLFSNGSHTLLATAYDKAGNQASTRPVTLTVKNKTSQPPNNPPSVPTGLKATNVTSGSLTVSWNASTDTDKQGLAGYYIYRNGQQIASTKATSFNDSDLTPGTTYTYQIAAYDKASLASAKSVPLNVTTQALIIEPGDANSDGVVDLADLSVLLHYWDQPYQRGDFAHHGKIDISDLSILLSNYGRKYK